MRLRWIQSQGPGFRARRLPSSGWLAVQLHNPPVSWAEAAGIRVLHQVDNPTCEDSLWSPDSRHILEDKTATYKPCAYTGEAGGQVDIFDFKRSLKQTFPLKVTKCPRAAPRTSRGEGFCRDHSRAVVSARFLPFLFFCFLTRGSLQASSW